MFSLKGHTNKIFDPPVFSSFESSWADFGLDFDELFELFGISVLKLIKKVFE